MAPQRAPFPSDPDDFAADTRIAYSKEAKTFLLEDEQGEEWEWLSGPQKWSKTMDEALMKQQAEIYKVAGVDEDAPALNPAQKRKEALLEDPESNPKNSKVDSRANAKPAAAPRQNTAIFVTGLPLDTDMEEVQQCFGRYGVIAESDASNEKRIKLYKDEDGQFKGEALIIYHRPESVGMAIDMADDFDFPRLDPSMPTSKINVSVADRSFKAQQDGGEPAQDRPKAKPSGSRAAAKKKVAEMNSRLNDWSDDEVSTLPKTASRGDKVVVVKGAFKLGASEEDLGFTEEDIMDAAKNCGEVKNITLFDLEPEGILTVRFSNAQAAKAFCDWAHGRPFDGRTLSCSISTGDEKFRKTRKTNVDKDEEEAKRLEEYSKYIEGKDGSTGDGDAR